MKQTRKKDSRSAVHEANEEKRTVDLPFMKQTKKKRTVDLPFMKQNEEKRTVDLPFMKQTKKKGPSICRS